MAELRSEKQTVTGELWASPEDDFHIHAESGIGGSATRVLKCGDTFAVFDRHGDIGGSRAISQQGLYHRGTRFLSQLRLTVGGGRPLLLNSSVREHNVRLVVDQANPDLYRDGRLVLPYGSLHVSRHKIVADGYCSERVVVTNHSLQRMVAQLGLEFDADFIDLFEVRGMRRERRGRRLEPQLGRHEVRFAYVGLDDVERATVLRFSLAPDELQARSAQFTLRLDPKAGVEFEIAITCHEGGSRIEVVDFGETHEKALAQAQSLEHSACRVRSSNEHFNAWFDRSLADLIMMITQTRHGDYPYAGVPWYSTPFGRDGIITAMQSLWVMPSLSRGVLSFLAATQAHELDPAVDAEPGKIVHEIRDGEMSALREVPFAKYYGTVDATPLFIMLAGDYYRATGDLQLIRSLWPNLLAATAWIDEHGDSDRDGFVEYGRRSEDGLLHQGWKDSQDPVFHADGSDAEGPIALCEVQAYVYGAKQTMAILAAALGDPGASAAWREQAERLRSRFDERFWNQEIGSYVLALDGRKRPCEVLSSNAGHCLYTGIATGEHAQRLAQTLMDGRMFSGWGLRTLAAHERRYNPMSYHNGSIWPHDNALVAAGLARYGYRESALRILNSLFEASLHVDLHRLPELFCGFSRREGEGPILYPVACAPQAWAAVAPFQLLQAVLGLSIEGDAQRITFDRPMLPASVDELRIDGLQVGAYKVDLTLHRYPTDVAINVASRTGPVEVVVVK